MKKISTRIAESSLPGIEETSKSIVSLIGEIDHFTNRVTNLFGDGSAHSATLAT